MVEVLRLYHCFMLLRAWFCLIVQTMATWSRSQGVLHHQACLEARPKVWPTHPHDGFCHSQRWHWQGVWEGVWWEAMNFPYSKNQICDLPIRFFSTGNETAYLIQVSGLRFFFVYNHIRNWRMLLLIFTSFLIAIFIVTFFKYTLKFFLWRQHL